jgi:hypothetical protein|tara:strand:+ start:36 stop:386 length:351 start_codon:yes stop_codon:yes gene_type:complete
MGFTMKGAPYGSQDTPIYSVDMEDGVLGKANNNGTIVINSKLKDPKQIQEVIDHETEHIFQMRDGRETSKYGEGRGRLDYDNENVYWEGKTIPRSSIEEGAKDLPWEKEAYNNTKK